MDNEIHDIKLELNDLKQSVDKNIEIQEIKNNNLIEILNDIRNDFKEEQQHRDKVINELQIHFDNRLNTCHRDFMSHLNDRYYSKPEIDALKEHEINQHTEKRREEITKAILASEQRMEGKAKLIAWIIGTMSGMFWSSIGLAIDLYQLFKDT